MDDSDVMVGVNAMGGTVTVRLQAGKVTVEDKGGAISGFSLVNGKARITLLKVKPENLKVASDLAFTQPVNAVLEINLSQEPPAAFRYGDGATWRPVSKALLDKAGWRL
jgi:hypothetical protein